MKDMRIDLKVLHVISLVKNSNFLFNPVMATIPNTPLIPTTPSTSEDTQTSGTDLEEINTKDEMNTDISKWSDKERKK